MSETIIHRLHCAVITRGCMNAYVWENSSSDTEIDPKTERLLALSGWRLDHGLWICGAHERKAE